MSLEVALHQRLVTSPYTRRRFWDERPVIALIAGDMAWIIRDRGLLPASDGPTLGATVDAVIRCTEGDLAAMAGGRAPASVSYTLGGRSGADRRKQACVLLVLAALGWCGPWPDPSADPEHVRLVRAAHYDLGIGPTDGVARLFPEGGPLPEVTVRLTHGAQGIELVTVGLADVIGRPEVATVVPGRGEPRLGFPALRVAALAASEGVLTRALPAGDRVLRTGPHPRFPDGLALPNQLTWLVRVGWA
ncbi:MAG: hypothetical protein Q8P18_25870 [Pseudomonadota bacterium]|nr:hypothetical protein [Pseudomonadota bacterium]